MDEITRRSPLAHRADLMDYQDQPVTLTEITGLGMIDVRVPSTSPSGRQAVGKVLGFDLPTRPRTSSREGETAALWLSIDQWLITLPYDKVDGCLADLRRALSRIHSLATDVSDARAVIRLTGVGAREIVMKGASPDLTAPSFRPGAVRRMQFAEIAALCHYVQGRPQTLDLYVFRSYADFAWEWLARTSHPGAQVRLWRRQRAPEV